MRNRIKGLEQIPKARIAPNPKNWRIHGNAQRRAMQDILKEVGLAAALIGYENAAGQVVLIDGHMRLDEFKEDEPVPVLMLDVGEAEANKLLAAMGVISDAAGTDVDALDELMREINTPSGSLNELLSQAINEAMNGNGSDEEGGRRDSREERVAPDLELLPYEHYDYVLVMSKNVNDFHFLCDLFGIKTVRSPLAKTKIGLGRGVLAAQVIERINAKIEAEVKERLAHAAK